MITTQVREEATEMTLQEIVSKNIQIAMIVANKNQQSIATALNIGRSTVSQKIHGRVAWTLEDIEKAAKFFNIEPAALVGPQGLEPWTQRTWYVKDDFILAR